MDPVATRVSDLDEGLDLYAYWLGARLTLIMVRDDARRLGPFTSTALVKWREQMRKAERQLEAAEDAVRSWVESRDSVSLGKEQGERRQRRNSQVVVGPLGSEPPALDPPR